METYIQSYKAECPLCGAEGFVAVTNWAERYLAQFACLRQANDGFHTLNIACEGDTPEEEKLFISWLSGGVSSFIASYLVRDKIDELIYIDIDDQHPDTMRFVQECAAVIGKPLTVLKSRYGCVENACRAFGYVNGVGGAKCTEVLKKRVRKEWEREHANYDITYVWGFDNRETHRSSRLIESMPDFNHVFPLIEHGLTKEDVHGMCEALGIKRPAMYDMGYRNNNCIGCVKGGMGYWNRIRVDFPDVFKRRAAMERDIGHSCIKGVFLDELEPDRGRLEEEIMPECGIMCMMNLD